MIQQFKVINVFMFMFISSLAATIAMTTACNSSKLNELNRIRVSPVPSTNTISKSWMVIHNKKKLASSASLKRVNFSTSSSSLFYLSYSQVFILLNLQSSFGVIGNKLKSIAQYWNAVESNQPTNSIFYHYYFFFVNWSMRMVEIICSFAW